MVATFIPFEWIRLSPKTEIVPNCWPTGRECSRISITLFFYNQLSFDIEILPQPQMHRNTERCVFISHS